MNDEEYPYVVPVSFGIDETDGLHIYFHCAEPGKKLDLWKKYPKICFEGDVFPGCRTTAHGAAARFKSVIGTGTCTVG